MEEHPPDHGHKETHQHGQEGPLGWLKNIFAPHSHDPQQAALDSHLREC
jgi:hypothetical protein